MKVKHRSQEYILRKFKSTRFETGTTESLSNIRLFSCRIYSWNILQRSKQKNWNANVYNCLYL